MASDKLRMALAAKFRVVARDRFVRLRDLIHALEADPSLSATAEELLRELHTLKGEARMMGFLPINEVAHQAETLMIHTREVGVAAAFPLAVGLLIRALDAMLAMLDDQPMPAGFDSAQFTLAVQAIVQAKPAAAPAPAGYGDSTPGTPRVSADSNPAIPRVGADSSPGTPRVSLDSSPGTPAILRQQIGDIRLQRPAHEGVRVSTAKLDQLTMLTGELVLGQARGARLLESLDESLQEWRAAMTTQRRALLLDAPPALRAQLTAWFNREQAWLERMSAAAAQLRDTELNADTHLASLEASVRALRLVPLGPSFGHFRRAILDLAREQGKQVQVTTAGDDVELDAEVIDHISEPLIHLARNCVDHGVELPPERVMAHKHPRAQVHISAQRLGAHVDIVVSDDGRGLNTEAIRRRAVERGLLDPDAAPSLPAAMVWPLIFSPGFSTRDQASDISGRGVGLDVVKQRVEALGGHVSVDSAPNGGTRFSLSVPVSIAIAPTLVVEVGGQFYGLPSEVIAGVVQVRAAEVESAGLGMAIRYEEQRISLIDLHPMLDARAPSDPVLSVVVLQLQKRRVGLRVSRCVGERQAVQRALDPFIEGLKLINGTSVLDTGDVILILNSAEVMRVTTEGGAGGGARLAGVSQRTAGRHALVVDDSELTRDLVAGMLRGWGYAVTEAADGDLALRALAKAQTSKAPVDLLVTDIDMPNMDGFSLLRAVRAAPEVRDLPVIVLSTRSAERDKRTALQLGADGYVVKAALNPQDFRRLVGRFLT